MEKVIVLSSRAVHHLEKAFLWYHDISAALSKRFEKDVFETFSKLQNHPGAFRKFKKNTRRIILKKFPYMVVYATTGDTLFVVAIFHLTRSKKNKQI